MEYDGTCNLRVRYKPSAPRLRQDVRGATGERAQAQTLDFRSAAAIPEFTLAETQRLIPGEEQVILVFWLLDCVVTV